MTWQTFVFLPVAGIVFGYSFYRIFILIKLMKAHRGEYIHINRFPSRLWTTFANVFGQKSVLRDIKPGIMHAIIFGGFYFYYYRYCGTIC